MDMRTHTNPLPEAVMPACQSQKWLAGQKALVTGAGTGIGREIALALAQFGAEVAVNYVSAPAGAEATVGAIRSAGGGAIAVRADVSDEAQVESMFNRMLAEFGTIDILVNNAGL